jgi:hypothetical protein
MTKANSNFFAAYFSLTGAPLAISLVPFLKRLLIYVFPQLLKICGQVIEL